MTFAWDTGKPDDYNVSTQGTGNNNTPLPTDPNIIDVTYNGMNYNGRSVTPIAFSSASVALIDDTTGAVSIIPLNQADALFGRDNLIIINPNQAMPAANDSIVVVPPAGPLAVPPSSGGAIQRVPTPGILVPREPAGPPTVGQLGGLIGKETSRIGKLLGKLGRAGKLIGPIAGVAALLFQAIEAAQRIFGDGHDSQDKGGKYNGGDNEGVPGTIPGSPGTGAGTGTPSGTIGSDVAELLERSELVDILLEIECGKLSDFAACACDPNLRRGVVALDHRFSASEQYMLYRKMCGCAVKPQLPAPNPAPAINIPTGPVIPTVYKPDTPAPQPVPTPAEPVCYTTTAPPVGTYPTGFKP